MDRGVATWLNFARSSSRFGIKGVFSRLSGPKCTRMKKVEVVASPYCCESTMFRSCWARKPVTAWTIPGRSGQESVKVYSSDFEDMISGW